MFINIPLFLVLTFALKGHFVYSDDDVLNVGDQTEHMCYMVIKTDANPMSIFSYVIGIDKHVTKVLDSADVIWQAKEEGEYLSLLRMYRFYKLPRLAYVFTIKFDNEHVTYLYNLNSMWINVSGDDFNELIRKHSRNRRLDLSEIDEDSYHVQDTGLEGLPSKIYITKEQYELTLVLDDFDIIWQSPDDNHICTCVVVHGADGDPRAVNLHIMGEFTQVQEFHFKINGNWEPVTKHCFYSMLKEIDDEIDKSKSQDVETNTGQDLTFY